MKDLTANLLTIGGVFGAFFGVSIGLGMLLRNFEKYGPSERIVCGKYANGQSVKISSEHRFWQTEIYVDLNKDFFVDGIARQRFTGLLGIEREFLKRESDYESHKNDFDQADKILQIYKKTDEIKSD